MNIWISHASNLVPGMTILLIQFLMCVSDLHFISLKPGWVILKKEKVDCWVSFPGLQGPQIPTFWVGSWLWLVVFIQAWWILVNAIRSTRRSQRNLIFFFFQISFISVLLLEYGDSFAANMTKSYQSDMNLLENVFTQYVRSQEETTVLYRKVWQKIKINQN